MTAHDPRDTAAPTHDLLTEGDDDIDSSEGAESTEGLSSLLADGAPAVGAEQLDELQELDVAPDIDVDLIAQDDAGDLVLTNYASPHARFTPNEVDDTPGDDALIAEARIDAFEEAHLGAPDLDEAPFDDDGRVTDDGDIEDIDAEGRKIGRAHV